MQDAEPSIIREMLKLSLDPSYISFAGDPDPEFFPISQILSFNKELMRTPIFFFNTVFQRVMSY